MAVHSNEAFAYALVFDQEYTLNEETDTVSKVINTGTLPLNVADTLGSAVNVLEKVTKVEPPAAVLDEPYCMVGIDDMPPPVMVVLVFKIT